MAGILLSSGKFRVALLMALVISLLGVPSLTKAIQAAGSTYYVSKSGNNADGKSWATAWNELNQINWGVIQPGDSILIDGGSPQMVYTTPLIPAKSGSSGAPITVKLAPDAGRNGQAIIFGGRSAPLPECFARNTYVLQSANATGIDLSGRSWIVIDGTKWHGISIHGNDQHGISMDPSTSNVTIRDAEVYDNGTVISNGSTSWDGATSSSVEADGEGIHVGGSYNTFSYMDIHDNGQDAFQTGSAIHYITVDHSWLHNARLHPDPAYSSGDVAWNYCSHSDGMQIYNGGVSDHLTFDHNVHGPGLLQGSLLGQALSGGESAQVNYVTITNSLFVDGVNADVMGYATTSPVGWVIDHNTIFVNYPHSSVLGGYNHAINLDGSGHVASNNVIYQGRLTASGVSFSGNCIYNLLGSTPPSGSIVANPQFVTPPANISLSAEANADYTLQSNSPCSGKGSSITSVAQLAGQNSAAPLSTSTPFPSTTSTPGTSATPALTPVSSPTVALVGEGTSVPTATATTVSSSAPTATKTTVNSPTPQPTAASTPVELPASTNTPTTVPSPTFTPTVVPSPTPTNTATVVPSATPGHGKGNGHKPSQATSSTSPQPTATFTPTVLPGTTPPHGNKP